MSAAPVATAKDKPKTIDDAAAQLKRLLITLPMLADDSPHKLSEMAELLGVKAEALADDLRTLVTRFDDGPGGFVEGVRLAFGPDSVQLDSHLFKRPMGLTADEIGALEVGLAALERELPPHEAVVAARARARLVAVASEHSLRDEASTRVASHLVGSEHEGVLLADLRTAISFRKKVELSYRSGGTPQGAARSVHPYGIVYSRGKWFLVGMCEKAEEIRVYRVDRIVAVKLTEARSNEWEPSNEASVLLDDLGLIKRTDEKVIVQYLPAVARWIAEREHAEVYADGTVQVAYPLLDDTWAISHALQYANAARIISPQRVAEKLAAHLAKLELIQSISFKA